MASQVLQTRALRLSYRQDVAILRARRLELGNRLQVGSVPSYRLHRSATGVAGFMSGGGLVSLTSHVSECIDSLMM